MKKIALMSAPFFIMASVSAGEITSRITDSVQLTVDGPMVQSTRMGSSYAVSGNNVSVTTLGGLSGGTATAPPTLGTSSYDINTDGQAFTFSENGLIGDTVVTSQSALTSGGRIDTPNLYGNTTSYLGGTAGSLAGVLSPTGTSTVTAGGSGSTVIGQRTVELSVFE
jgi:hypothetical protein